MPEADSTGPAPQPWHFLLVYALAAAGGAVAYVPFLTILLPAKIAGLEGAGAVAVLAGLAFAGAIAASVANIGFGWLSDRTGVRRPWIFAGLVLSSVLLVLMGRARDAAELLPLIVAWQLALNMMLGPLAAWAGDCVPDTQKGVLGGLLAGAPALGALSGALVTWPGLADGEARYAMVALLVVAMIVPVLLLGGGRVRPELMASRPTVAAAPPSVRDRIRAVPARMWLARLLVQIAEAALFAYLLLWFRTIDGTFGENDTARIFSAVLIVAIPVALLVGRWSDRASRPIAPLIASAAVGSAGLVTMALAPGLNVAIAGYVVFGLAMSVFLALHSAQTLRVLPRPETRGRDLGLFNLTNTVPSLVMPALTLALVPRFGFEALFVLLGGLALLACLILAGIRPAK